MKGLPVLVLVLGICSVAIGQDSLGDVARKTREEKDSKPRAKTVIDDEATPAKQRTAFPDITMRGLDNTDEIISAMNGYMASHTPEEFEAAVREWYETYDRMMADAIEESSMLKERHIRRIHGAVPVQDRINDYRQMEQVREAQRRADDDDGKRVETNGLMTARIQQTFGRVRSHLQMKRLKFDWFKIRFGNGNGSW
jgi:hypothetical protein